MDRLAFAPHREPVTPQTPGRVAWSPSPLPVPANLFLGQRGRFSDQRR